MSVFKSRSGAYRICLTKADKWGKISACAFHMHTGLVSHWLRLALTLQQLGLNCVLFVCGQHSVPHCSIVNIQSVCLLPASASSDNRHKMPNKHFHFTHTSIFKYKYKWEIRCWTQKKSEYKYKSIRERESYRKIWATLTWNLCHRQYHWQQPHLLRFLGHPSWCHSIRMVSWPFPCHRSTAIITKREWGKCTHAKHEKI